MGRVVGAVSLAVLVAWGAGVAVAQTSFWQRRGGAPTRSERELRQGNFHLAEARRVQMAVDDRSPTPAAVKQHARAALKAYERALALGVQDAAEVHYRALTAAGYIEERRGNCHACRDGYEAIVRHADLLRLADPLDGREAEVTWELGIALAKLGGLGGADADAYFERAVREYEHWRKLADEANPDRAGTIALAYGNAAEILMALGRLDEAIQYYRNSIELNPTEALAHYGLAIAYDRNGEWDKAVATMRDALLRDPQLERLESPLVFFIPDGDVWYYYALAWHVKGNATLASDLYRRFLNLAKSTRYAARAREHLDELGRKAETSRDARRR